MPVTIGYEITELHKHSGRGLCSTCVKQIPGYCTVQLKIPLDHFVESRIFNQSLWPNIFVDKFNKGYNDGYAPTRAKLFYKLNKLSRLGAFSALTGAVVAVGGTRLLHCYEH